jgi:hypothetical protein
LIDTTVPVEVDRLTSATVKINGSAPVHRSQTREFGAKVPNRVHRGQARPLRLLLSLEPGRGLALGPVGLRTLTVVHSSLGGQRRSGTGW